MTDDTREPLPCWLETDEAGVSIINGQLMRFDMFARAPFAWQDTDPDVLLAYLEKAHRWILDGKLPGKPGLASIKGGKG